MRSSNWYVLEQCERIRVDAKNLFENADTIEQKELLGMIISRTHKIEIEVNTSGKSIYELLKK
tara:strand:+ start:2861 stop:3049 length:189 start_codon:yes stop_codon:yes gene_type:complete